LRRERNHESDNARHDGTGQRHGRGGNARRIACIAIGLLTEEIASRRGATPNPKTLFNGAAGSSSLCFLVSGHTALAPGAGVRWPQSGRRMPRLRPPNRTGGAVRLF
jgi:hypothetical protein